MKRNEVALVPRLCLETPCPGGSASFTTRGGASNALSSKAEPGNKLRGGFILVELLVVMAIIAILVAILIPTISSLQASGRSTQSTNNLEQMGKALKNYQSRGLGNIKLDGWQVKLKPYLDGAEEVFVDPSDINGSPS